MERRIANKAAELLDLCQEGSRWWCNKGCRRARKGKTFARAEFAQGQGRYGGNSVAKSQLFVGMVTSGSHAEVSLGERCEMRGHVRAVEGFAHRTWRFAPCRQCSVLFYDKREREREREREFHSQA